LVIATISLQPKYIHMIAYSIDNVIWIGSVRVVIEEA